MKSLLLLLKAPEPYSKWKHIHDKRPYTFVKLQSKVSHIFSEHDMLFIGPSGANYTFALNKFRKYFLPYQG